MEKGDLAKTPEEKAALSGAIKKARKALVMGRKPAGYKKATGGKKSRRARGRR